MLPASTRAARGFADVCRALAAAAALFALLVGPPVLLWQMAPILLPTSVPGIADLTAALTTPDDGTLFLRALAAVAVAAWASFAVVVIVEALARLRGWRVPAIPLLAIQQRTASGLLAAVAVLFVAPAAIAAAPAIPAAITAPPHPSTSPVGAATGPAAPVTVQVTVQRGDTLWGIAEHHLHQGERYPELVEATRAVTQPDGRHLQDADEIYPGWVVVVPQGSGASTPSPTEAGDGAATSAEPRPETSAPMGGAPELPPAEAGNTAVPQAPTWAGGAEPSPSALPAAPEPSDDLDTAGSSDQEPVASLWTVGAGLALSGLTAAGISALVRRRRQRQQRHRRAGQRLPVAPAPVQAAQRQVDAGQDPFTVEQLDRVLRTLGARCGLEGTDLPDVQSVRLSDDRIELHLRTPSRPVFPFAASGTDAVLWHLDRHTALTGVDSCVDGPTPFPTLVVIGRDLEGGLVLVDLEAVTELSVGRELGRAIGREASQPAETADEVEAVLSALVVDTATSPWGAEGDVTVIGPFDAVVAALAVAHVEHTDAVDELLDQLGAWAADVQRSVRLRPGGRPAAARVAGDQGDALRPRVLVVGRRLSAVQTARLQALTSREQPLPLAIVSAHPVTPVAWTLALSQGAALAVLEPTGLRLSPQQLSAEARDLLVAAVQAASAPPVEPGVADNPRPSHLSAAPSGPRSGESEPHLLAATSPTEPVGDTNGGRLDEVPSGARRKVGDSTGTTGTPPRVAVLGPVEVQGPLPGSAPSNNLSTMTELVALLALYPHSQPHLVDSLLWPGERVPRNRRNQLISRTRSWLGSDADGTRYLPLAATEGYRLAPSVRSDWDEFQDLVGDDPSSTSTDRLVSALSLVRGQPFAGVHPYRYAWADVAKQSMIELVVDVAVEVTERALEAGDASQARRAAAVGLQAEPGSEQLWRAALRAEHLAGNRDAVEALVRRFTALAEELGDDLEAETRDLITQLLPRTALARGAASEGSRHAP